MSQTTVAAAIRDRMDEFTPAERRVARVLLADYPSAGLSTASELAARAGTSAPSVVRFTTRLGMCGFADLQERLRLELGTRASSPVDRVIAGERMGSDPQPTAAMAARRATLITESMAKIPHSEIDAAVDLLATSRLVLLSGGYFSHLAAQYLRLHLALARPKVFFAAEPTHRDLGLVLDLGRNDVLVLFDFRRYEPEALATTLEAKQSKARVIVFTDEWLSPASAHADVVLPVTVDVDSFDSFVACIALIELLLPQVFRAIGEPAFARLRRWEKVDNPTRRGLLVSPEPGRGTPSPR
ncbi:MAG: MurR/RpiR family transcriptional regulator [Mycobacterium sp.]